MENPLNLSSGHLLNIAMGRPLDGDWYAGLIDIIQQASPNPEGLDFRTRPGVTYVAAEVLMRRNAQDWQGLSDEDAREAARESVQGLVGQVCEAESTFTRQLQTPFVAHEASITRMMKSRTRQAFIRLNFKDCLGGQYGITKEEDRYVKRKVKVNNSNGPAPQSNTSAGFVIARASQPGPGDFGNGMFDQINEQMTSPFTLLPIDYLDVNPRQSRP